MMTKQKLENLIPNTPSLKKPTLLKNLSQKLQKIRQNKAEVFIYCGPQS